MDPTPKKIMSGKYSNKVDIGKLVPPPTTTTTTLTILGPDGFAAGKKGRRIESQYANLFFFSPRSPACPVVGIDMSVRSGSTLLCQMLSRLPRTDVLIEPYFVFHTNLHVSEGKMDRGEARRLAVSSFRLLCKSGKQASS